MEENLGKTLFQIISSDLKEDFFDIFNIEDEDERYLKIEDLLEK